MNVAPSIVFNYRFDANIPKLERVYGQRFDHLLYLVPFYDGDRPDVVPTHSGPHEFHGFFIEALGRLRSLDCTHVAFASDDLILHPALDQRQLAAALGLDARTGYISSLEPLAETTLAWPHLASALLKFALYGQLGARELPPREQAEERLARLGYRNRPLGLSNLAPIGTLRGYRGLQLAKEEASLRGFFSLRSLYHWQRSLGAYLEYVLRGGKPRALPYPLLMGYADFVIVPTNALEAFCRYCSVFAAMGVFVEIGLPTALVLACDRVVTERETSWRGERFWGPSPRGQIAKTLNEAYAAFGERQLYLHPIKLSRLEV